MVDFSYLSVLPKELRDLLSYYINYQHWACLNDFYIYKSGYYLNISNLVTKDMLFKTLLNSCYLFDGIGDPGILTKAQAIANNLLVKHKYTERLVVYRMLNKNGCDIPHLRIANIIPFEYASQTD